ncbi:hypothetical protein M408DRAFT_269512 [Serendipita vermifera MAFF 305830]|uniref:Uncharacterized protein n=1 Tax=Serendipita vermifera MAFF 305830 TaxID=933852 RepID=A0A0C2X0A2_SERVB|nr:hypothetical protein M408DRAFT_269512 [Serendipita vermifera MAFF 305830]
MATPPTLDRAYGSQDGPNARASSQPPSRRNSDVHHLDSGSANAPSGALEVPYQPQSAGWDTVDFSSGRNTSPGYPYTPSYRDSFTPYGSDSGVSWTGGREANGASSGTNGQQQLYDDPVDNHDVEYNPADFDGPGSQSDAPSPYFLDQDGSRSSSGMDSGLISGMGYNGNGDQIMNNQVNEHHQYSPRMRTFSSESHNSYNGGTPHARMNSLDVNSFSPRPISAGSPASSVGGLDIERPRSRASSIGSVNHQSTPSLTVGPMGDAFDKLGFDAVDSDIMWRNQQQQLNQQGVAKSPPQLLIPNEGPSSTLQIPSFGTQASLTAGLSTGGLGLSAPGINILPATPVSGGAGASNVPFDTVLKNLNHSRQNSGNADSSNLGMMQSHAAPVPTNSSFPHLR